MEPPSDDLTSIEIPESAEPDVALDELPPSAGLSRRSIFVDMIAGAIGLALSVPLIAYILEPVRRKRAEGQWIKVGPANKFQAGERTEVDYAFTRQDAWLPSTTKRRVIVAAEPLNQGRFTVFSSTCTHLGCGVRWDEPSKKFLCPCHGGTFDSEGRPIAGPVFRPLDRLQARVGSDGELEVLEA